MDFEPSQALLVVRSELSSKKFGKNYGWIRIIVMEIDFICLDSSLCVEYRDEEDLLREVGIKNDGKEKSKGKSGIL